jgi:hypothetical protein
MARITRRDPLAVRITEFADQSVEDGDEFVIPEDLSTLSVEDITALHEQAVSTFDTLYSDGKGLSEDDLTALAALTSGIEGLNAELAVREAADTERSEKAAALAAKIRPDFSADGETDEGDGEDEATDEDAEDAEGKDDEEAEDENAAETVVASGARVNLSAVRSRAARKAKRPALRAETSMSDVVLSAETGEGMDWDALGRALNTRLSGFNKSQYEAARKAKRHISEQKGFATLHRQFDEGLVISSSDPDHISSVLQRAADESRLEKGSLIASGGWCAPSETLYDLMEMESRDGLFSMPEIGVKRGGINFTPGPDFSSIYTDITGFHYTEDQDIAGTYGVDAEGMGDGSAGDKPCYKVECPDFEEVRLEPDGLCLTAGLLQSRGYPEVIARTIRGALIARDHRTSARLINQLVLGSTAVTMTAAQVGATAPLLDAIEKQAEHYKYTHRMARSTTLEAVFPYWVHGVVRSDLARRLGVELLDVPNSRIDGWFRARGIAPQYVYDWQPLTGGAAAFTVWPSQVSFLLYAAGTWVKGAADVISLDTMYDSTLLGQNDYTALFIEDAWFTAKLGHDSRVVTVALCPDGATGAGVDIACNGTAAPAV